MSKIRGALELELYTIKVKHLLKRHWIILLFKVKHVLKYFAESEPIKRNVHKNM